MKYHLEYVVPKPIEELDFSGSEIWNKKVEFINGQKYLVSSESGAGKTTLLSILYGIRNDYIGKVLLNGDDIKTITKKEWNPLWNNKLSFVFQGLMLFDELSALENVLIKNNLTNHKTHEEILEAFDTLGIAFLVDKPTKYLSFGQKQRVAIIRALCQPFDMLLLDEPFSHLDDNHIKTACEFISKEVDKQGSGMILSSLGASYYFDYNTKIYL